MASRICLQKATAARSLFHQASHRPAVLCRPVRLFQNTCAQAESKKEASKQNTSQQESSLARQPQSGSDLAPSMRGRAGDLMTPFFPGFGRMSRYIDQMQREMDELMERMMPGGSMLESFMGPSTFDLPMVSAAPLARQLAFEVEEDDKNVKLRAEVPGLSKDDIKVTLSDDNVLTIRGEKKQESEEDVEGGGKRTSMMYRSVFKQLRIPQHVTHDKISVETKDGVLTIALPKVEAEQRKLKEIPVQG